MFSTLQRIPISLLLVLATILEVTEMLSCVWESTDMQARFDLLASLLEQHCFSAMGAS